MTPPPDGVQGRRGTRPVSTRVALTGAVLTGGRSRRMGDDKALLPVAGVPMAHRVAAALHAAGATEVLAVGGDHDAVALPSLRVVPDLDPGCGPLAGIVAALTAASDDVVVVAACDMPWLEPRHVHALVDALADRDVAVSAADGRWQPVHAAWNRTALPALRRAFRRGERAPMRAIHALDHVVVELGAGRWATDVDTPAELAAAQALAVQALAVQAVALQAVAAERAAGSSARVRVTGPGRSSSPATGVHLEVGVPTQERDRDHPRDRAPLP